MNDSVPEPRGEALLGLVEATQGIEVEPAVETQLRDLIARGSPFEVGAGSCALGLILRQRGQFDEAKAAFRRAGRLCQGDAIGARARVYLAGLLGRDGAFAQARRELAAASAGLANVDRPLFELQSGFVAHLSQRSDDARQHFEAAIEAAALVSDERIRVLALNNLANVLFHDGQLGPAEVVLRRVLLESDPGLKGTVLALHNLGDVLGRRGQVREGVELLDSAAADTRALALEGHRAGISQTQILVEARLAAEALRRGEQVLANAREQGHALEIPELLVILGRANLGLGRLDAALGQFTEAQQRFAEQDRSVGEAQCALVVALLARHEMPTIGPDEPGADAVFEALIALGDQALVASAANESLAADCWYAAVPACDSERAPLRILGHYALARRLLGHDDLVGAVVAVEDALDELAGLLADINAVEMRSALVFRLVDIESVAVDIAAAGNTLDGARLLDRANAVVHSVTPLSEADTDLVNGLTDLRNSLTNLDPPQVDSREVERLEQRLQSLHRRMRRSAEQPAQPSSGIDAYTGPESRTAVLFFAQSRGHLWRLSISPGDSGHPSTLVDLGDRDTIWRATRQVRLASDGLARRTAPIPEQLVAKFNGRTTELDALLFDRIDLAPGTEVLLLPGRFLTGVPWRALPHAKQWRTTINVGTPVGPGPSNTGPSNTGPSNTVGAAATMLDPDESADVTKQLRALVVAGPGLGPGIDAEIAAVAEIYADPIVLTGDRATSAAVLEAFRTVDIAHVAGHGSLHPTDPLLAMIGLADGPLTVYDIETSMATPPTVVLASCLLGAGASTGDEVSYGFAAAMASRGTQQLIISPVELDDARTAQIMPGIHRRLAAGTSVTESLHALDVGELDLQRVVDSLLPVESQP